MKNRGRGPLLWLTRHMKKGVCPERAHRVQGPLFKWYGGFLYILTLLLPAHDRHLSVTGPSIGCTIGVPVRRDSSKFAFSAKYHFAGRSASSISINRGLYFNPPTCSIIASCSCR